jgi:hypothetical protein
MVGEAGECGVEVPHQGAQSLHFPGRYATLASRDLRGDVEHGVAAVPDAEPLQSMAVRVLCHAFEEKERLSCGYFEDPGQIAVGWDGLDLPGTADRDVSLVAHEGEQGGVLELFGGEVWEEVA